MAFHTRHTFENGPLLKQPLVVLPDRRNTQPFSNLDLPQMKYSLDQVCSLELLRGGEVGGGGQEEECLEGEPGGLEGHPGAGRPCSHAGQEDTSLAPAGIFTSPAYGRHLTSPRSLEED